ncbi:MAG: hypothetical protein HY597_01410 [Candidatus Omnitrophica bacterium]|nr:hypothetical protein [Candidatus Omnitrophota bacterium]
MPNLLGSTLFAAAWMTANIWAIAQLCRRLVQDRSPRRRWHLAGSLALKFPLLYGIGYAVVRWLHPSAAGLAVGVTLGLASLLVAGAVEARMAHDPSIRPAVGGTHSGSW